MARNGSFDHPVMVSFELVGNDVCSYHYGVDSMTTPEEFRKNIMGLLDYLNTVLPAGSHIVVSGLGDGRVLYDSMWNLTHPIGGFTYSTLYDFLNCL